MYTSAIYVSYIYGLNTFMRIITIPKCAMSVSGYFKMTEVSIANIEWNKGCRSISLSNIYDVIVCPHTCSELPVLLWPALVGLTSIRLLAGHYVTFTLNQRFCFKYLCFGAAVVACFTVMRFSRHEELVVGTVVIKALILCVCGGGGAYSYICVLYSVFIYLRSNHLNNNWFHRSSYDPEKKLNQVILFFHG